MRKKFKQVLSLILVFTLLFSSGVFQLATPTLAANTVTSVSSGQVYMFRNVATGKYMDANGGPASGGEYAVEAKDYTGGPQPAMDVSS